MRIANPGLFGHYTLTAREVIPHNVEPMAGIEPATDGLRNRCSTAELHWLPVIAKLASAFVLASKFPAKRFDDFIKTRPPKLPDSPIKHRANAWILKFGFVLLNF